MWWTNHSSGGGGGLVVTLMTKTKLVLKMEPEPRMNFHKVNSASFEEKIQDEVDKFSYISECLPLYYFA